MICLFCSPDKTNLENAGFLELMSITWASDVIISGFKKALKPSDLGRLSDSETAVHNYNRFLRFYEEEKGRSKDGNVSFGKVFIRLVRTKYIFASVVLLVALALQVFSAVSIHCEIFKKIYSDTYPHLTLKN